MSELGITVKYLYHSGFSVETAHNLLIFDYYRGEIELGNKQTWVFSSHSHPDHFNTAILDWQKKHPKIHYIFSKDINVEQSAENITFLAPEEECQIGPLQVKAFGSTDLGVSFLVKVDGTSIFHAGDLNWWYWWDDTPENISQAETDFKNEIAKIKGEHIDLAFFPVDPRLEHNYALGGEYFIQEVQPRYFVPMHFWKKTGAVEAFARKMARRPSKIIALLERNAEIQL